MRSSMWAVRKMLDATQKTVNKHFSKDHWLNDQENAERFIDYVTYYRRNMCQFIQEYLGINLYWYQMILIYLMNAYPAIAVVAARASAKSWVVAVYACAKAILYPKTKVVIMSATKNMSSLIVEEKIKKELIPRSRRLALEIVDIVNSQNKTEVKFGNDSSIVVVPALESGLGNRLSLLILKSSGASPKISWTESQYRFSRFDLRSTGHCPSIRRCRNLMKNRLRSISAVPAQARNGFIRSVPDWWKITTRTSQGALLLWIWQSC